MSLVGDLLKELSLLNEMSNLDPDETGLPTLTHLYKGILPHNRRIKVQLSPGPINRKNAVSVAIHDPNVLKGNKKVVAKFRGSSQHSLTRRFIELNREALVAHARDELTDAQLRQRLIKV